MASRSAAIKAKATKKQASKAGRPGKATSKSAASVRARTKARPAKAKTAAAPAKKTSAKSKTMLKASGGASRNATAATAKSNDKTKAGAKSKTTSLLSARPPRTNGVETSATADRRTKSKPRRAVQIFPTARDIRLLVVDDEPEVLELLAPFLRRQGYTVSEAQDGDQALEKILTERPNIVILDVMMPGLSGWEISRYVRERSELDPVRIIMATGIGKETNAATSPLYGADAYIDKPFRLEALHRTVREVVSRIERGAF